MADGGTLLSDLDNAPPVSDRDLVNSIYADLNTPSQGNPVISAGGQRMPMQNQQGSLPNTLPNAADPAVPTAHMIGREHPTAAEFDRMLAQGPLPYNSTVPQMGHPVPQQPQQSQQQQLEPVQSSLLKNWQGQWSDELKQPLLVAIILFVLTLPAVHLLVGHYVPKLLNPGGSFTTVGLLARALVGGALFWILQRVIGPLLSL